MEEEKEEVLEEEKKEKRRLLKHLDKIGFSNRLSLYILLFLFIGLIGGFYLAIKSIQANYLGTLVCWTVVFTPIGTMASVAIGKVVDKSKAENTVGGIKYELAVGEQEEEKEKVLDSPPI